MYANEVSIKNISSFTLPVLIRKKELIYDKKLLTPYFESLIFKNVVIILTIVILYSPKIERNITYFGMNKRAKFAFGYIMIGSRHITIMGT